MNDEAARTRIARDLGTNFLVEAGAGSGKTTALVSRLITHVRTGTRLDALAAVTFTRKAANELRERFQLGLEQSLTEDLSAEERERITAALSDLDRAFIGTIHAFCGRLLREHALEAGLDPTFTEEDEAGWPILVAEFWQDWVDRCRLAASADFVALRRVHVDPGQLKDAFAVLVGHPDARFPRDVVPAPDVSATRRKLEALLDRAERLLPAEEPEGGWDDLQSTVRRLRFRRYAVGWNDVAAFCEAIAPLTESGCDLVQKRWSGDKAVKQHAKALAEDFVAFVTGDADRTLTAWREHRYQPVLAFLERAAEEFATWRRRAGRLGFEDLLERCAHLLRTRPSARVALGARYRHLLVDEFQDTDPIQAEVCFLLASDPTTGNDWRTVSPRPGALFVVGDPKQSIYRFRRADIQTYDMVKRRIEASGAILTLTRNFRSTTAIAEVVNGHFAGVFPADSTDMQPAFSPLESVTPVPSGQGIARLLTVAAANKESIQQADAVRVAAWIASRLDPPRIGPGSFMVLVRNRKAIEPIARALSERNIPVQTAGAPLPQETELHELLLLLRVLASPDNPVLVVAALEGLFVGLAPEDLFAARQAGIVFRVSAAPVGSGPVADALALMHRWWTATRGAAPDVLFDRLLDETGLLPWAASQPLGEARAGALLRLVESLRGTFAEGVHDLASAVARLEELLERRDADDAPLRPGRGDAVRVMNLHKAKGLEADIVLLAAPVKPIEHEPSFHVARAADGLSDAWMVVDAPRGGSSRQRDIIAQPPGWAAFASREADFLAREEERLLYVAVTRARCELVVSQYGGKELPGTTAKDESSWRPLQSILASAPLLTVPEATPPGREQFSDAAAVAAEITGTERWHAEAARAGWRRTTVTLSARAERWEERSHESTPRDRSHDPRAWGRAVHRGIEAMGRGRRGEQLAEFVSAVVRDEQLADEASIQLLDLLVALQGSDAWHKLTASGEAVFEFPIVRVHEVAGAVQVLEGVVDAASFDGSAWRVFDWKTGGPGVAANPEYVAQVQAYAEMISALSGSAATGEIIRVGAPGGSDPG